MGMPPILQQLGRNNMAQMIQPVRQMMNMVRTAQNPQLALNQLIMNNPQMKQVMDIVNQYGGDSMAALDAVAKQCGMTADEVLKMIK